MSDTDTLKDLWMISLKVSYRQNNPDGVRTVSSERPLGYFGGQDAHTKADEAYRIVVANWKMFLNVKEKNWQDRYGENFEVEVIVGPVDFLLEPPEFLTLNHITISTLNGEITDSGVNTEQHCNFGGNQSSAVIGKLIKTSSDVTKSKVMGIGQYWTTTDPILAYLKLKEHMAANPKTFSNDPADGVLAEIGI